MSISKKNFFSKKLTTGPASLEKLLRHDDLRISPRLPSFSYVFSPLRKEISENFLLTLDWIVMGPPPFPLTSLGIGIFS